MALRPPDTERGGSLGISPQTTKAAKVLNAAIIGERSCEGRPYSSLSMKRVHRSRSAVTISTALCRPLPVNPLASKI